MISISWPQLLNPELSGTLNKVVRAPGPFARSIKVLAIVKAIETEMGLAKQALDVLRDKYMQLNEHKTMWVPKDGMTAESEAATKDFEATTMNKDLPRLKFSEMESMSLSAHDLAILEPFMTDDLTKPDLKPVA